MAALTLALDTTGESYSLALWDGELLAQARGGQPRRHLVELFPALAQLLQQTGRSLAELQRIAVTAGPGSFTGVRTGLLIAKTLAQSLAQPLIALDTLEVLACNGKGAVVAALDARKGQVIWGLFQVDDEPRECGPSRLDNPEEWLAAMPAGSLVLGSACKTYGELLATRSDLRVAPAADWHVQAAQVAWLAQHRPAQEWAQVQPNYVRSADVQVHGSC